MAETKKGAQAGAPVATDAELFAAAERSLAEIEALLARWNGDLEAPRTNAVAAVTALKAALKATIRKALGESPRKTQVDSILKRLNKLKSDVAKVTRSVEGTRETLTEAKAAHENARVMAEQNERLREEQKKAKALAKQAKKPQGTAAA